MQLVDQGNNDILAAIAYYSVSQKSNPPKAINNILAYAKPFWANLCAIIGNLYPHVYRIWVVCVKS